ncbi:hypothetical protein B0J12DRAFT_705650 [Macrophomina phaseolina]|uniref:F-box domain-containing protein n=1 Tax=Macrophomina phaseolina TaxID=35725 RepID=A0ABQ8FRG8_9PEZI|nr:hypothetical protein B0J12DRAFT_705650 [Macrophomina phaseolina]
MSLDLPTELFWHVLTYLEDSDLFNLRSICKSIDSKCLDPFGRRCFRIRQFMLSAEGLQALCTVANGRFGRFVRTLRIGSEALACSRTEAGERQGRFRDLYEGQVFFRLRGIDTALLSLALRSLSGTLEEIVVAGNNTKNGHRSWGARRLEVETGTKLINEQTRTLSTTLAAIASSQIQLRVFRNEPMAGQRGIGAHRDSISMPYCETTMLCNAFSALRVLQLSLWVPEIAIEPRLPSLTVCLVKLLSTMPNLEELHLGLQRVLQAPELGEDIGSATFSTSLRIVHVVGGCMQESHVSLFLINHLRSLRTVVLEKLILEGGYEMLLARLGANDCSSVGIGLSLTLKDVQDGVTGSMVSYSSQISEL